MTTPVPAPVTTPSPPAPTATPPAVAPPPHRPAHRPAAPHARLAIRCRRCDRRILMVLLDSGRRMPVELMPDPTAGTIAVAHDQHRGLFGRVLQAGDTLFGVEQRYRTHFGGCPARDLRQAGDDR